MSDDIYDEHLSYKTDNLIPKLNGLSMIKTGSDSDLKGVSSHRNGYIHHNETRGSLSGSQVVVINAAMHIERLDIPSPLSKGYSQGDGKYRGKEIPHSNFILTDNRKIHSTIKFFPQHSNKQINGLIGNGEGDRPSLSDSASPKTGEESEILSQKTKFSVGNHVASSITNTTVRSSETSSLESFYSSSIEEDLSNAFSSDDGCKPDKKEFAQFPKKFSPEVLKCSLPTEENKDARKPVPKLLHRSYYDLERGTTSHRVVKYIDKNLDARCSLVGGTRRYFTKLEDDSYLGTFPEKSIRRKIISALAEKGDQHCIDFEDKIVLPQNWENLIGSEHVAWHRWYVSKLQQSSQKQEARKLEEKKKRTEEERQKENRFRKQETGKRAILMWRESKDKENETKQRELARKLELERRKKEIDQAELQKIAERNRVDWSRKKDMEKKEQKMKEEKLLQENEETKRLQVLKSKLAYEVWNEKSKTKPKPMSIAIKDRKGHSDPALAQLNWNPIPWQNLTEELKTNIPKGPRKKKLVKPFST